MCEQTFEVAKGLAGALGKAVCVSADRPGFIVNRVLMPMVNEARVGERGQRRWGEDNRV